MVAHLIKKLRYILAVPPEPFLITRRTCSRVQSLIDAQREGARILNIGAGGTRLDPRVINIDIYDSGTTDIIASGMMLPIADRAVDLVILQGVLEHVDNARQVLDECARVLKPGGVFYTEMPFLQPYHECPIDLRRSTRPGLSGLCAPLEEIESGIHIGPASALTWMVREILARLISGSQESLYPKASSLIGWIVFPLKYADFVLERIPSLHTAASSCYYIGRKGFDSRNGFN